MAFRIDPTSLAKYGRLALVARNIVEGFLTGVHKSPYRGFSIEFAEHRQYYPGDEIRHIDWHAYGKTDRYYIKEFEDETNVKAHLILDASGSMAFQGKTESKFQFAQHVAASLAYLMLNQLDAVGLVTHDTKVRQIIPPRTHSKQLLQLMTTLEKTQPKGETALAPIWDGLASQLNRRGFLIILSDCFDDIDSLLRALYHFRHQKHEVLLFHILAPEEIDFPFRKLSRFHNLEVAGDRMMVDPNQMRDDYLRHFGEFCRKLREQTAHMKIDYHLMRTDEPIDKALGIYLARRQRRR